MNRPKLDKPRLAEWHNDDEQLSNLLDHIDKKVLNVDTWEFRVAHLNKYVSYSDVLKNIQERYLNFEWTEALKDSFIFLPDKFRVIKQDLFSVFKRFTLNLQERLNYIQSMEKYVDELEERVEKLQSQVSVLKEQGTLKGIHSEINALKDMINHLQKEPHKDEDFAPGNDPVDDQEEDSEDEDPDPEPVKSPGIDDPEQWRD